MQGAMFKVVLTKQNILNKIGALCIWLEAKCRYLYRNLFRNGKAVAIVTNSGF